MKKAVTFITLVIGIIFVLSIIQIVVSNKLSTTGIVLGGLQDQIKTYKTENTLLAQQLLVLSSYNTIASSAADLGFITSKSPIVLSAPLPLAIRP